MRRLSDWLHRISSALTIVLAIVLYGIFLTFVMVPESTVVATYAGDWGSPDGHWFYTPDELYHELSTWGEAGRAHYVAFRLGLDPVWALVYTLFLVTITSLALRNAFAADDRRQQLNVITLIPMLADLGENALGIALVSNYPDRCDLLAWITASLSAFKWSTLTIAHLIMLYALGAALVSRLRRQFF
ncbi:MAG: hypothetical protein QGH93_02585 [Gammaproteobacteria bacterium]|jgi:hypothetical protein|nr:hypothetical protein [Chromatiales bacterium]MDP6673728.1 hypothetical protein [Gammaproteobacteria bacterium]